MNHPAVLMWHNYELALGCYMNACIVEWVERGYKNSMKLYGFGSTSCGRMPWWLGNRAFHASHRAALLAKDPSFYSQYGWKEQPKIQYYWPTKE